MTHLSPYYCKLGSGMAVLILADPFATKYPVRSMRMVSMHALENSDIFEECEEVDYNFAYTEIKDYIDFLEKGIEMGYDLQDKLNDARKISQKIRMPATNPRAHYNKRKFPTGCVSVTVIVEAYNDCYC